MIKLITLFILLLLHAELFAQKGNWDTYLAQYEKGPGSTLLDMDLKKSAPDQRYPYFFSAGVKFTHCGKDGLPLPAELNNLYRISDSVVATVSRYKKNILAGSFTYQCERRDYFYVTDTTGLKQAIITLINKRFQGYTPVFNIKKDEKWEGYLDFLYPNELTLEYMKNQKVFMQLGKAGDKLVAPRQIDHWFYFRTEADQDCFLAYATGQRFKIVKKEKTGDANQPYKLQLSRPEKMDLAIISKLTLEMEKQAKKCNGDYDGWETFVVK